MEERRRGTKGPLTSLQFVNASFIAVGFKEIVFLSALERCVYLGVEPTLPIRAMRVKGYIL
jgi:hypothetical protein